MMPRGLLILVSIGIALHALAVPCPAHPSPEPLATRDDKRAAPARVQTLLARSGFSPGLIDGKPGRKTKVAIEQFQKAKGLTASGIADEATLTALETSAGIAPGAAAPEKWTRTYRITESDLAWITGPIPADWNERAELQRAGYADLQELLAERGWCSTDLVATINPGTQLNALKAGDEVELPDVPDVLSGAKVAGTAAGFAKLSRLEIDLSDKLVKGFDAAGTQVMLLHCSIARLAEKRPVGDLHVAVVATDPEYTFDPKDWPEIDNVTTRLKIAPGPRNPVGLAWIGLDKPGYGMHGSPRPQDIGKTGSHGCFRLANWDAVRLARAVKVGMVVEVRE